MMKVCKFENCKKTSKWGIIENLTEIYMYCDDHKKIMQKTTNLKLIEFKRKRCIVCKETRATYGKINTTNPTHCKKHVPFCEETEYEDVVNKKCAFCKTRPTFGIVNTKKALYCINHVPSDPQEKAKYEDVINKSKLCIYEGCKTRASYGSEKKVIYCAKHAPSDTQEEEYKNVVSHRCIHTNCKTIASFRVIGTKKVTHCSEHVPDHINYENNDKKCKFEGCKTQASFGLTGTKKVIYCAKHVPDRVNYKDMKHKKCSVHLCEKYANTRYNFVQDNIKHYYCAFCFANEFPEHQLIRNFKTKERAVADFIKTEFPNFDWIYDKMITDGCSKKRPDIFLDLGYQIIIIEVDENKHSDYLCENKRMMQISQDVAHRPIIFIRFNPDSYYIGNKKIASCWKAGSSGKISFTNTWQERLDTLKIHVNKWLNEQSDATIKTEFLFYNS